MGSRPASVDRVGLLGRREIGAGRRRVTAESAVVSRIAGSASGLGARRSGRRRAAGFGFAAATLTATTVTAAWATAAWATASRAATLAAPAITAAGASTVSTTLAATATLATALAAAALATTTALTAAALATALAATALTTAWPSTLTTTAATALTAASGPGVVHYQRKQGVLRVPGDGCCLKQRQDRQQAEPGPQANRARFQRQAQSTSHRGRPHGPFLNTRSPEALRLSL